MPLNVGDPSQAKNRRVGKKLKDFEKLTLDISGICEPLPWLVSGGSSYFLPPQ